MRRVKVWFNHRWPYHQLCLHPWCLRPMTADHRCHIHYGDK